MWQAHTWVSDGPRIPRWPHQVLMELKNSYRLVMQELFNVIASEVIAVVNSSWLEVSRGKVVVVIICSLPKVVAVVKL